MTWEKFKAMSSKQKIEHIWEYYRWHILIFLMLAVFFGSWIHGIVTHKEPILQVTMINCYGESPDGDSFIPFLQEQGRPYYDGAVVIGKNIQFTSVDAGMNMASMQMLACTVAAGEPDLMFWDSQEILPSLDRGTMLDLRQLLPEEALEKYQDQLVYCEGAEENGETYPCGIYLPENPWILQQQYYVNCTVGIPYSCKDTDLAVAFIQYLLNYGQGK